MHTPHRAEEVCTCDTQSHTHTHTWIRQTRTITEVMLLWGRGRGGACVCCIHRPALCVGGVAIAADVNPGAALMRSLLK